MLPILTTAHLTLRGVGPDDLDGLWKLLTEPDVRRYLCDDRILTRIEVQAMLTHSIEQARDGMGFWMLHDRDDRQVGCVGVHPVSAEIVTHAPDLEGEIEPTIALAPDCWGRGYATEALTAAIAYAFETLKPERLVAVVDEPNHASQRLMGRVGFTQTGSTTGPRYPLRTYRMDRSNDAVFTPRGARPSRRPR